MNIKLRIISWIAIMAMAMLFPFIYVLIPLIIYALWFQSPYELLIVGVVIEAQFAPTLSFGTLKYILSISVILLCSVPLRTYLRLYD